MSRQNNNLKQRLIIEYIENEIKAKRINSGDILPSENFLISKFGFSRNTVRSALQKMVISHMIIPFHGKGYVYNMKFNNNLSSYDAHYGKGSYSIFIKSIERFDYHVILKTSHWYELIKVRYFKDRPYIYTIQEVAAIHIDKIGLQNAQNSLYGAFDEAGIEVKYATKEVDLIPTPEDIKTYFHVENAQIILLSSITYSHSDEILQVAYNYYLGEFHWRFIEYSAMK